MSYVVGNTLKISNVRIHWEHMWLNVYVVNGTITNINIKPSKKCMSTLNTKNPDGMTDFNFILYYDYAK